MYMNVYAQAHSEKYPCLLVYARGLLSFMQDIGKSVET